MNAYVLIQTEWQRGPLAHELLAMPGVVSAEDLEGAYDAIAIVSDGSTSRLVEDVMADIAGLPGVTRVLPARPVDPSAGGQSSPGWSDPRGEAA